MLRIASLLVLLLTSFAVVADELPRTIAVSGHGTAQTTPDRATVRLSIQSRNQSVAAAQQEAAEVAAKVLALAEELEIPENRVDTMSSSVRPDYRWNQRSEEQELRGYVAERNMRIEVHDLDKVGVVIEKAVELGVNQVSPPQLSSSRQRDAYREALERAVEDARENAETLASSLGLSVGSAMQVSAGAPSGPQIPMMVMRQRDAMAMESAPETYNAGDLSVSANVTVVFGLTE